MAPDALEKQGDVIPAQSGDPTHADCIAGAQEDSSVDAVRLDTITNTDPASLTDIQRKNWFEFFRRNASSLKTVCISLWTEPVTGENAAMRNEEYRGSENENGCLTRVERYAREKDVKERARWVDTLELLERPYLSLTTVERMLLRLHLYDVSYCYEYYPQLYTGRWIPMVR